MAPLTQGAVSPKVASVAVASVSDAAGSPSVAIVGARCKNTKQLGRAYGDENNGCPSLTTRALQLHDHGLSQLAALASGGARYWQDHSMRMLATFPAHTSSWRNESGQGFAGNRNEKSDRGPCVVTCNEQQKSAKPNCA